MQAVTIAEIDRADQEPLAPFITHIVFLVSFVPKRTFGITHVFSESGSENRIDEFRRNDPVVSDRFAQLFNGRGTKLNSVPATKIPTALAFVVHRSAERDDALDSVRSQHRHPGSDPSTLGCTEDEGLFDAQGFQGLQIRYARVWYTKNWT